MDPDSHSRLSELFLAACNLPPEQQTEFLDNLGREDQALRSELEAMLRADPGNFFDALDGWATELPDTIGTYRILGLLGRGGMSVVYLAEQRSPKRQVALKVLRPDLLGSDERQQLEREAQMLGELRHSGIAQVFEASQAVTPFGTCSFFAMEFVDGLPLIQHAREHRLSVSDRIRLLVSIGNAVAHAHQKGIIHCDLKPSNILVDGQGQPKVLDFGVARSLRPGSNTPNEGVFGTVAYMSPEQASGTAAGLDTRTDVYSLGVIAYELLAERHPYAFPDQQVSRALALIQTEQPAPLQCRDGRFWGELETITERALAKDRDTRYPSMRAFTQDLDGYLRHRPVSAFPSNWRYRLAKTYLRNPLLSGVSTALVLSLLVGAFISLWLMARAQDKATEAHENMLAFREARDDARESRRAAESAQSLADLRAYRASIWAASHLIEGGNTAEARRKLEAGPEHLRDWEWWHLWGCLDDSLDSWSLPLEDPGDLQPLGVAFSPDGKQIAYGTSSGLVSVVDCDTRAVVGKFQGHSGRPVIAVSYSAGGEYLAASTANLQRDMDRYGGHVPTGHIMAWRVASGEVVCSINIGNRVRVRRVDPSFVIPLELAIHPEGTELACTDHMGVIWIWTTKPDGLRGQFSAHLRRPHRSDYPSDFEFYQATSLAYASDGTALNAICADGLVHSYPLPWNDEEGAPKVETGADARGFLRVAQARGDEAKDPVLVEMQSVLMQSAFDSRSGLTAIARTDGFVGIWESGQLAEELVLDKPRMIPQMALDPTGRFLAAATVPEGIQLFHIGQDRRAFMLGGAEQPIVAIGFTSDGDRFRTLDASGEVKTWASADTSSRLPVDRLMMGFGSGVSINADSTDLAVRLNQADVRIWGIEEERFLDCEILHQSPFLFPNPPAFMPGGDSIVLSGDEGYERVTEQIGNVWLWRVFDCHPSAILSSSARMNTGFAVADTAGEYIATSDVRHSILVLRAPFDAGNGKFRSIGTHDDLVTSIDFDSNSTQVLSSSLDGTVALRSVDTGMLLQAYSPHPGGALWAEFSPDDQTVLTTSRFGQVRVWDVDSGSVLLELDVPGVASGAYVVKAIFHPEGHRIATASGNVLTLWDTQDGAALHQWTHTVLLDLAFSPDGSILAVCSHDGVVLHRADQDL